MLQQFEHISKNGHDYVLVPEENFREIQAKIEDAEDLQLLRAARAENAGKPMLTHEEMMKELGLDNQCPACGSKRVKRNGAFEDCSTTNGCS